MPRGLASSERFSPLLNLKERQALGIEIEGDGSGALIAIRLESPRAIAYGAIADRYITVDFTGRRFFTLVETESSRWSDYVWNDGKGAYNAYRETIDFSAVESVSVWLQNIPPGRETRCGLGPVRALPLRTGRREESPHYSKREDHHVPGRAGFRKLDRVQRPGRLRRLRQPR